MIEADVAIPFFGCVENVNDPLKAGRVQVRVVGYNSPNKGILPTENLKWFQQIGGMGASSSGIGISPTGFLINTYVFGFYLSKDMQEGIILGSIVGIGDVSELATGTGGQVVERKRAAAVKGVPDARGDSWDQPDVAYATTYPQNKTVTTESGHAIEYDDTPGAERISFFHKTGTYTEMLPDGSNVQRNVGDVFEIDIANKKVLVNGDYDLFVNGDYRLNVGGEIYVKCGGNITFDTEIIRTLGNSEATDHISSNVSGKLHVHAGVKSGNDTSLFPVGATAGFFPTPANTFALTTEDTGFTPAVIQAGLANGFITEEDVQTQATYEPAVEEADKTPEPTPPIKPVITDCGLAVGENGKVDYSTVLAPGITLRSISLGAVVSQYAIKAQNGLTPTDIVCNLKNIAENVLVPLFKQYPGAMVTSGFRAGSGTSQHLKGEAVDIQVRGYNRTDYYNMAVWIKNNLPHDQLILEHKNYGSGLSWVHISLKKSGAQRGQVLTFFNNKSAGSGLKAMN